MGKEIYRQKDVTFEIEIEEMVKVTAKGYKKQAVRVSGAGENPRSYIMDEMPVPILECDKKSLGGGGVTISIGTYDVLSIKKTLFGIKVAEIISV